MKYYNQLYVSESLAAHKEHILKKIKKNKYQFNIYLVTLSGNGTNQLEIFDSIMLKQEYFRNHAELLVGVARGCEEALDLVQQITQDVYCKTNTANIKEYILNQQRAFEQRAGEEGC